MKPPKVKVERRDDDDQPELREGWTKTTGTVTLPSGETIDVVEQSVAPIAVEDTSEKGAR